MALVLLLEPLFPLLLLRFILIVLEDAYFIRRADSVLKAHGGIILSPSFPHPLRWEGGALFPVSAP